MFFASPLYHITKPQTEKTKMELKKIKDLKKGDFFTLKDYGDDPNENKVYVRGDFERSEKKYSVHKFSDVFAERFLSGEKLVFVGFIF